MRFDFFAGRNFAVRGFCGEGVIKADLPEGDLRKRPILPKETDFVGKARSDLESRVLWLKAGVMRAQNSSVRRKTAWRGMKSGGDRGYTRRTSQKTVVFVFSGRTVWFSPLFAYIVFKELRWLHFVKQPRQRSGQASLAVSRKDGIAAFFCFML